MKCSGVAFWLILVAVSAPVLAGPPNNLAPAVAAVYTKARAGILKTTDSKGNPRRDPFGPRFNHAGQVEVDVHYHAAPPTKLLKALGATIKANVPALSTVEVFITPTDLARAARLAGVSRITFPHYTFSNATGTIRSTSTQASAIDARAKQIMHVGELTRAIKASGKGVNVLVFSDGADNILQAANAGALPKPDAIWVDADVAGDGDEGTAMLEIVHAIAPDARLGFCGPKTAVDEFTCLNDEIKQFHADILVSDLGTTGEDVYHGNGAYLQAYRDFLNARPDLVYIHQAGNSAETFFEGPYTPSADPHTIAGHHYQSLEDFGLATGKASDTQNTFTLPPGETAALQLQWKDDWDHPTEQFAFYLFDDAGKMLASADSQQAPVRLIQYKNKGADSQTVHLMVACSSSECPRFFVKDYPNANVTFKYNTPASSADVIGTVSSIFDVGAVSTAAPDTIEPFSSRGPALSDGSVQPAFVAPDCIAFISVGSFDQPQFCGTSAAAPQVAGVLALLESSPLPGGVQALINGAVDLGGPGQDNTYGYGRIDAKAAQASLNTPPTVEPTTAFSVNTGQGHSGQLQGALSDTAKQAGLALHYVIVKQPAHGTVKLDANDGAYTYTAASGYSGSDQFTYASNDGLSQSGQKTATAIVGPTDATSSQPDSDSDHSGGGGGAIGMLSFLWLLMLLLGSRLRARESSRSHMH